MTHTAIFLNKGLDTVVYGPIAVPDAKPYMFLASPLDGPRTIGSLKDDSPPSLSTRTDEYELVTPPTSPVLVYVWRYRR